MSRIKGAKDLVEDAVDQGTSSVQKVHERLARRPFAILEHIPLVRLPARGVRLVHDAVVDVVYTSIRTVNAMVGTVAGEVIDAVEPPDESDAEGGEAEVDTAADEHRSPSSR